ncbi:MAG TPA: GNAT family N-acetyltransferase [Anaerolineae bacterium]|nr:GNAT family N-acetyltransferase [Anaerolineae bacterium]HOQ97740.1 GNAT family N-acetyltransferase [Anaerolineae bacterium]HPL27286.1 GNAT family N-acetyltransferase [Anaerolineae bacterium]
MLVREATLDDTPGIARVHVDTWRAAYAGIIPAAHLAGLSYEAREQRWRDNLTNAAPGRFTLVAEEAGEVVGFSGGGPERGADAEYRGEVYAVYVRPGRQRRGIGRQMVQACARRLLVQRLGSVLIWVLADNKPARGFYERLGGRPVREQTVEIGGAWLREVGYGWPDARALL